MVQVGGQFPELGPGTLLSSDLLFFELFRMVLVEQSPHLLILVSHMLQVLFASEEVVLVLARVVTAIAASEEIMCSVFVTYNF